MQESQLNRRNFLGNTIAGAAITAASYNRVLGANDRLLVANIGCGGRRLLGEALRVKDQTNAEVVAVCDTWTQRRDEAVKLVQDAGCAAPKAFVHYQDVLALKDVNAVIIGTPDHQHCTMLKAAADAGKDAYVEKPLAMNMKELHAAVDAVKKNQRIVQIGTQVRSFAGPSAAAEFIKAGKLGKVIKIEQSRNSYRPYWHRYGQRQLAEGDVDWKAFLMHVKYRPFDADQYAGWYGYRDFSRGPHTNLFVHFIDLVHYLTGAQYPARGMTMGGTYMWKDQRTCPDSVETVMEYPEQGFLARYCTVFGNGGNSFFKVIGTRGILDLSNWGGAIKMTGRGSGEADKLPDDDVLPATKREHHMAEFFLCAKSRKQPLAPIDAGYGHSIAVIIADESFVTGRRMVYNPAKKDIYPG